MNLPRLHELLNLAPVADENLKGVAFVTVDEPEWWQLRPRVREAENGDEVVGVVLNNPVKGDTVRWRDL